MSETKYILIYPFETRERAFDIANDIDGSLMWHNSTAYPRDNIPAFIVPLSEFSSRWSMPKQTMNNDIVKEGREFIDWFRGHPDLKHFIQNNYRKVKEAYEAGQNSSNEKLLDTIEELQKDNELLKKHQLRLEDWLRNEKGITKEQATKITKLESVVDAAKELMNFSECQYIYDKECGNLVDRSRSAIKLLDALSELGGGDE